LANPRVMRSLVLLLSLLALACQHDDERRRSRTEPAPQVQDRGAAPVRGDLVTPAEITALLQGADVEEWFGLYMAGRKVGYARVHTRPAQDGEPGGFVQEVEVVLGAGDERSDWSEVLFFAAAPPHRLVELRQREASDDGVVERRYENGV